MAWYSVLPSHLTVYETWIIRTFIVLAIVNLIPTTSLIVYDLVLYICRTIYHEIPLLGGRARGQRRPRAPSLADPNRRMSIAGLISGSGSRRTQSNEGNQSRGQAQSTSKHDDYAIDDEEMEK